MQIPFLPISAFKHHEVRTGMWKEDLVYKSSGTGGSQSRHFIKNNDEYLDNCIAGFEAFYGPVENYTFLALLPGYLEREGSSLITMMDVFIDRSKDEKSGFYIHNHDELLTVLKKCKSEGRKTILWGVTYALLDLGELYQLNWPELIVLETGGMKGRRKEMIKADLHALLSRQFSVEKIHSEYGMTELQSQAYSLGDGLFFPTPTMNVHCREIDDPLSVCEFGKTGIIHIFDSVNKDTSSFIATEDLGRFYEDGSFEIMGRIDNSDRRGCNLLMEEMGM